MTHRCSTVHLRSEHVALLRTALQSIGQQHAARTTRIDAPFVTLKAVIRGHNRSPYRASPARLHLKLVS